MNLCREAIDRAVIDLFDECNSRRDFTEGELPFDSKFLGFRRAIVLGYLAAAINSRCISGRDVSQESKWLQELLIKQRPISYWGEGAWASQLNLIHALKHTPDGSRWAEEIAVQWLKNVCPYRPPWPRGPYWTVEDEIQLALGESDADQYERARVSFTAASAMGILARRLRRRTLAELWPNMSQYLWARFVPDEPWETLRWHVEEGDTQLRIQAYTESWTDLRKQAYGQRSDLFAEGESWLLPYFLCVFPHRTDEDLAGELDFKTGNAMVRADWVKNWEELKHKQISVDSL